MATFYVKLLPCSKQNGGKLIKTFKDSWTISDVYQYLHFYAKFECNGSTEACGEQGMAGSCIPVDGGTTLGDLKPLGIKSLHFNCKDEETAAEKPSTSAAANAFETLMAASRSRGLPPPKSKL